MKIGVLCGDLSLRGGGIPTAVLPLYGELVRQGEFAVTLIGQNTSAFDGTPVFVAVDVGGAGRFGYAAGLDRRLDEGDFDLLHTHGLWTYSSVLARRWRLRHRRPTLVSPHGMLDPWALAQSKWKKKIARALFESGHLASVSCVHALNDSEQAAVRAWGYSGPVAVIPNGIALAPARADRPGRGDGRERRMLFLGRIAAKKGVRELLQAWGRLKAEQRLGNWKLVIAGWGDPSYEAAVRQLADELHLGDTVTFVGPRVDAEKAATYAAADAFILPSYSEGMPMAVLEAWSFGVPVLMTRACNLPIGFERGAAVEIDPNPAALAAVLAAFIARPDQEREAIGAAGRRLVEVEFTWPEAAARLASVYRWLLAGGSRPECVLPGINERAEICEDRSAGGRQADRVAGSEGG